MHPLDLQKETFSEKEKRNIEILDILRKNGPISRPDISQTMSVNVVTISKYIDDFIKYNLVYEKELDVSEGGRRPILLDLNPSAGFAIGVGLNLTNMVGLLVDLKGNIITKTQAAKPGLSVKEISESILGIVREILRRSKDYADKIKGIGIGIAGLVNKKDFSIHWPQRMDHYYTYASVELPLKEIMEREFDLPIMIENDATSACFGEHWLDLDKGYKNIIYMFSGVGCGLMINGEIYRGSQGYAGEASIYSPAQDSPFNCSSKESCFFKRWEVDLGMADELKAIFSRDKKAAEDFAQATGNSSAEPDLKSIFTAGRLKNKSAACVMEGAARRLGVKIAYLVNLLNPELVIIGGGFEEAGEEFLNQVRACVCEWAFHEASADLKICYSSLRENAVAVGAASLVLEKVFAQL